MSEQVIVITGASAGVGRATVRAFAREGAAIGLLARGRDGLEGAAREVEQLGGRALVLPTDVADPSAVERAAVSVEAQLGPIDVWVNNAMVSVFSPFLQMSDEEFRRVVEVTFLGYVHGTRAALRRMVPRDRGSIVQVSSALAFRSIPLQSAYCASKHAIAGFTESVRTELLHERSRVRLSMVHMPALDTPQFGWVRSRLPHEAQPVPPIFDPSVAAKAIVWAARHRRRDIAVGFPSVKAIFADKLAPRLADHYLARTGYDSQQTDEPADAARADNLWEPLPGDAGANGTFGSRARRRSLQLWLNLNRLGLAAGLGAAGLGFLAARGVATREA